MPQTVTLTAPANDFKKWQKDIPCAAGRYITTITLSDLHPGSPYESAAQIILRVPSIEGRAVFSIMTIYKHTPLRGLLDITGKTRDTPQFTQYSPTPLNAGSEIHVELIWESKTGVHLIVNGHDRIVARMKGAISALEVTASGATAKFDHNEVTCDLTA